jgi:hypothetical protein
MQMRAVAERLIAGLTATAKGNPLSLRDGIFISVLVHDVNWPGNSIRAVLSHLYFDLSHGVLLFAALLTFEYRPAGRAGLVPGFAPGRDNEQVCHRLYEVSMASGA